MTDGTAIHDADADILHQRAQLLARPVAGDANAEDVLEFVVAGQRCALALCWLKEVRAVKGFTSLPFAAAHVLGIVNVRGRVVPVIDLAFFLGLKSDRAAGGKIVALGTDSIEVGFVAQEVGSVVSVSAADIQRRSIAMKGLQPEMVHGSTAAGVLVIDGEQLMALIRNAWTADAGRAEN